MDLQALTLPDGISAIQARDWLRRLADPVANESRWREPHLDIVEMSAPPRLADAHAKSAPFLDWALRFGFMAQEAGHLRMTQDGLQVMAARVVPRTPKAKAWQHIEDFLVRARWLAEAPLERMPVRLDGLYLFGSMLDETRPTHGDADIAANWTYASGPVREAADAWFDATGFTFPDSLFGRDYRHPASKSLAQRSKFLAVNQDPERVFRKLLAADAGLAAIEIEPSREAPAASISTVLANAAGRPALEAVRARIASIKAKVSALSDEELAHRAMAPAMQTISGQLEGGFDRVSGLLERTLWWASLGKCGPHAALAAAAGLDRLGAFDNVIDDVTDGMKEGSPPRREWERQWGRARRAFDEGIEAGLNAATLANDRSGQAHVRRRPPPR